MEEKEKRKNIRGRSHTIVVVALTLLIIFFGLRIMGFHLVDGRSYNRFEAIEKNFGKLYDMQTAANTRFLWDVDKEAQMNAIYDALLDSFGDPYTKYLDENEVKELKERVNGSFCGIGILFKDSDNGKFEVVDVVKEGPADVAGIKAKDIIIKVDGKTFDNSDDFSAAIKGKNGSQVNVTYLRNNSEQEVTVTRGEIKGSTVDKTITDDDIGYIRIKSFGEDTSEDFAKAIAEMENSDVKGVVIDLRENPGGLFDEGVKVADILLPECKITYTKTKKGKEETFNSDGKHTSLKYVLLVNEHTASSAEVLAGAIKDNKGGALVGMKTFGKGIVQETSFFKDNTGMTVTTRQYFSPKGSVIHKKGITPDYEVELTEKDTEDVQLLKAISLLQ